MYQLLFTNDFKNIKIQDDNNLNDQINIYIKKYEVNKEKFKNALELFMQECVNPTGYHVSNIEKIEIKNSIKIWDINKKLNFGSKSFDLVISINTLHNLKLQNLNHCLQEIERIRKFRLQNSNQLMFVKVPWPLTLSSLNWPTYTIPLGHL